MSIENLCGGWAGGGEVRDEPVTSPTVQRNPTYGEGAGASMPEMFGFLRLVGDPDEEDSEALRAELARHAEREGFLLNRVYVENIREPESAFTKLVKALKQGEVKDVIVPSLWHFARLSGLQEAMRAYIEQQTGARVWVVQERPQHPVEPNPQEQPE